jgi:hypothetical protein
MPRDDDNDGNWKERDRISEKERRKGNRDQVEKRSRHRIRMDNKGISCGDFCGAELLVIIIGDLHFH